AGLLRFNEQHWERFTESGRMLPDDDVRALHLDEKGKLWVGTAGGVSCFDGHGSTTYTTDDGLAAHTVNSICTDPAGRTWFGTRTGGVSCFDGKTWRSWTTRDFLAGNDVQCLAVDLDGSIWVGTTTGVSHIVLKEPE
ncbi:MAG: hypothetical protein AMK73_01890, partial [Planctomycetes bacterium SM23_32]